MYLTRRRMVALPISILGYAGQILQPALPLLLSLLLL